MGFSEQTRLLALIMGCAVLWSLESVVPLYVYEKNRLRRALPNITLTVLLVLTNPVLSFAIVGVSNFLVNRQLRPIVSVAHVANVVDGPVGELWRWTSLRIWHTWLCTNFG